MLSQSVGYAAAALGRIAAAGGTHVLIKDVAEDCGIPSPYLAKIINTLARKGMVLTQRGVGGGVSLARPAQQITLYEICVALDDPIVAQRCMLGTAPCSDERACPAHRFWTEHRGKQTEFLRQTTIADIAAFETHRRWRHLEKVRAANGPSGEAPR
jgi:Rrf2 family protein